jgi:hypothetical protein
MVRMRLAVLPATAEPSAPIRGATLASQQHACPPTVIADPTR